METINHRQSLNTHRIIKPVHIFFKISGLATFSVRNVISKNDSKPALVVAYSKLGSCYNWIFTLLMIWACYVASPGIPPYDYAKTIGLTQAIRTVLWALGNVALIAVLVSYCMYQIDLVRIGNHLIEIDWELRRLLQPVERASVSLILILAYMLTGFLGIAIHIMDFFFFRRGPFDRLTGRIPRFVMSWYITQYFSVVSFVNAFFVDVNRALLGVSRNLSANLRPESSRESRRTFVSSSSMQIIPQLRNLHERLCRVSIEISQFYSVPILPAITYSFFRLSFMMYYLSVLLIEKETRSDYGNIAYSTVIIVSLMHPVLIMSNKITNIMDEISSTGRTVHFLLNCAIDKNSRAQLKQFSLQLLHYRVEFVANGYFTLDNTFVNSMVGVVFTYLVILVQFHLESTSSSDCSCNDHGKGS